MATEVREGIQVINTTQFTGNTKDMKGTNMVVTQIIEAMQDIEGM